MPDPRIVLCTTCKGRSSHLAQTLPQNVVDNADYPNVKFVVVDYGDTPFLDLLIKAIRVRVGDDRVVSYRFDAPGPFHMAHAKNVAARCGILEGADILVTVDADNYTGPGFATFIADRFREPDIMLAPNFRSIRQMPWESDRPLRGYAGRLAIRAQEFIKMGGYCETYDTWRGEDTDLLYRIKRRGGITTRFFDTKYLRTIPHNADVRFKEWPEARQYEHDNTPQLIEARPDTVVNFGKFGCGTVYRNHDRSAPVELKPLPTRVFGIGMQRTATTSLHKAFQILGYDSLHWGTGEAPKIWQEINSGPRSVTLERFYALSDMPFPLLYKKVDELYPGSKFILTERREEDWIKSVERLWSYEHNPNRTIWDVWPFSHRVHKAMYGRVDFDAPTFLARYRQHNAEAREYFKWRQNDLLVMDMDDVEYWHWIKLCDFLDVPVPKCPYPYEGHMGTRLSDSGCNESM